MLFLASRFEAASSTNSLSSSSSVTKVVTCMNERAAGELNRTLMNRSSLCLSRGARAGSPPALSSSSSVPHITFSYCLLNTMMMPCTRHQTLAPNRVPQSLKLNSLRFKPFGTTRCLKLTEKVSLTISEASYVYSLSGQKLIKYAKNGSFWRVFENLKLAVK